MAEKKRRGHHEGSVYFDTSRDRWVAAISVSPGKRKKFYFEKKQDAIKKKNEALKELERGTLATGEQRRLGEYLEDWLENVHKSKLRVGTYINHKKLIRYIVADLGDIWLQKLTPQQVQAFYAKKLDAKLSSKIVYNMHGVLHLALKNAVRWGLVSRNVCDLVTPPSIVSREVVPLTEEQARLLIWHVRGHHLEVLLATAVVTGMRRGELLALRWSDIDFARSRLLVLHSVNFIEGYGYVEGKPKTAAGKQAISLPDPSQSRAFFNGTDHSAWQSAASESWPCCPLAPESGRGGGSRSYSNTGHRPRGSAGFDQPEGVGSCL